MPGSPFFSLSRKPRRRTTHKDHTKRCVMKAYWKILHILIESKDSSTAWAGSRAQLTKKDNYIDIPTPLQSNYSLTCSSSRIYRPLLLRTKSTMWRVRGRYTGTITYQRKVLTGRPALGAYIGFLGVIWFTWLQVMLFDVRFARDSVFERVCKAAQLAVMVGFASAGTRFTTRVQDDNVWAFQSLSLLLAGSRTLLAIQYTFNSRFFRGRMEDTAKGMKHIVAILGLSSVVYLGVSLLPPYRGIPCSYRKPFAAVLCLQGTKRTTDLHMDRLVCAIWARDVDGDGDIRRHSPYRSPRHTSQRANGTPYLDHHWRRRHNHHQNCE